MNFLDATNTFEQLKKTAGSKSEVKVYDTFIAILLDLKNKDLTDVQVISIENYIDTLNLQSVPEDKKKYFRRKLSDFKSYLKSEYSLVPKDYYSEIGVGLGLTFGVVFGTIFNMAVGISMGLVFGIVLGRRKDAEAEAKNLVLNTRLQ
jgi:hypothetical protein